MILDSKHVLDRMTQGWRLLMRRDGKCMLCRTVFVGRYIEVESEEIDALVVSAMLLDGSIRDGKAFGSFRRFERFDHG